VFSKLNSLAYFSVPILVTGLADKTRQQAFHSAILLANTTSPAGIVSKGRP
jgi:hypothetical protein